MIKKLTACLGLWSCLSLHPAALALTPNEIIRGIPHQALFSTSIEGDQGIAVGAGGQIMMSDDGGATWRNTPSPTKLALLGVAQSGDTAIAVGQMGVILVRQGTGDWQMIEPLTQERLMATAINAQGIAFAVGSFGALLRSTDGGLTWTKVTPQWEGMFGDPMGRLGGFFEPSLYDVDITDEGLVHIVGELTLILRSEDGGETFEAVMAGANDETGVDPSLFALDLRADGVGFAVGQEGLFMRTTDYGKTWALEPPQTTSNLLAVSTSDAGEVVMAGMRDALYSRDGGVQWERIKGADIAIGWYSGVAWPEDSAGPYLVGNAGAILQIVQ